MALTKFKLVHHDKLQGLHFGGNFIPFEKLTDELAEQLIGKTHILERLPEVPAATVAVAVATPAAAEEAPAPRRAKS